ncbi:RELT-like protein 2 isoform X2 [Sarcophilus harrisii]|uniref:RELT-like protein 2 isoform X2 n=1 Tax=Sarcophilus harrisii TaxID=9305 RepID=UPI001301FE2A|nr:RELT-like protein 2 isoform X2 [Sarcophilus harrisii]
MSELQPGPEPQHGLYMLFLLVLVFFLMGLVGFMICHVLKKKGYRCRTSRGSEPEDAQLQLHDEDVNEDTVERIVQCIIQNEANAEALKEMLGDSEGEATVQLSSLDGAPSLQDGTPSHHHTVHLGSAAPCIHCSRNKRPPLVRQGRSKEGKGRTRPGETTVFSVGRFRVTHIEKRFGLHDHRDGSPTDRSWGSSGEQDPGGGQSSGKGQIGTGPPAIERLPASGPEVGVLSSPPVQNGGLRERSLTPSLIEAPSGAMENLDTTARGDTRPVLTRRETNGQPAKLDASDLQVSPPGGSGGV